tara:strand:- start:602 stop:1882 length:1281 start_codon:yes stop_codon:yes gene_type:complete
MYKPFLILSISTVFIFIISCSPVNNKFLKNTQLKESKNNQALIDKSDFKEILKINKLSIPFRGELLNSAVEIILPNNVGSEVTKNLINSLELSIYKKEITNISLNINRYKSLGELKNILNEKATPGTIFIGTLKSEYTNLVKDYCDKGILFFSFAPKKESAKDCVYLINFFPEDDLLALFKHFPKDSKVALLYPENAYGYKISEIIDLIAEKSNSLLINRASYKEDLTNAREAIKDLSNYDFRKYELERQKKILKNKNDKISKKALKKIERFETIGNVNFTHIILPDYGIRLLEIAPLLPFYDVDPNIVQFVGTGVWDDSVFFDEPSLQGAIFSGIEVSERLEFFLNYENIYQEKPIRTATIPYDLLGIINYIISKNMNLGEAYDLLDNSDIKFNGIDGRFSFVDNIIFRDLNILTIQDGKALKQR